MRRVGDGSLDGAPLTLADDGGLLRSLLEFDRSGGAPTRSPGSEGHAGAALRPLTPVDHERVLMQAITNQFPAAPRGARSIDRAGRAPSYPMPDRSPVLPRGWAPLTADQQCAVLEACDAAADGLAFRLGSLLDADVDYRAYRLHCETWPGLWVATRCFTDWDGVVRNRHLLGLGSEAGPAIRIALDFFNSDLAARGESWRLLVEVPAVLPGDSRRI